MNKKVEKEMDSASCQYSINPKPIVSVCQKQEGGEGDVINQKSFIMFSQLL